MRIRVLLWVSAVALVGSGCLAVDETCLDDDNQPVACEGLEQTAELSEPDVPETLETIGGVDGPGDFDPGPDDLDGIADEGVDLSADEAAADPDVGSEFAPSAASA